MRKSTGAQAVIIEMYHRLIKSASAQITRFISWRLNSWQASTSLRRIRGLSVEGDSKSRWLLSSSSGTVKKYILPRRDPKDLRD